jgi:hypothetical protein
VTTTSYSPLEHPNSLFVRYACSCHRAHHFLSAHHHTGDHAHVLLLAGGPFDSALRPALVLLFTVEYIARCAAMSHSWSAFFWGGMYVSLFPLPFLKLLSGCNVRPLPPTVAVWWSKRSPHAAGTKVEAQASSSSLALAYPHATSLGDIRIVC